MGNLGNHKSNIDTDKYFGKKEFKHSEEEKKQGLKILVKLKTPIPTKSDKWIDKFYVSIGSIKQETKLRISDKDLKGEELIKFITYQWTPSTHMRDFEVLHPFTEKEIRISRGQTIGVIISNVHECYIKLIYDESCEYGVNPIAFTKWYNNIEAKQILNNDLTIGYNVLIYNGVFNNLVEPENYEDKQETLVILKSFEKYAKYEPSKKRKNDDNNNYNPKKRRKI